MRWEKPFFLHLQVPRETLAARLPQGLTLDAEGDEAVISLVALEVIGPAPRLVERSPLAPLVRYRQLNVRTYVRGARGRGLYFLDARVDRRWPMVARALGWPYRRDPELAYTADTAAVAVRAAGIAVKGLPAPKLPAEIQPDAPERPWLERYLSYGVFPGGALYVVRVGHRHWRTRPVIIDPDSSIDLGELGPGKIHSAQLAESVDVQIDEVMPASEQPAGRLRRLVERTAFRLVQTTP
jgi:uncharacterized protein YqjF (DUF2071 family)